MFLIHCFIDSMFHQTNLEGASEAKRKQENKMKIDNEKKTQVEFNSVAEQKKKNGKIILHGTTHRSVENEKITQKISIKRFVIHHNLRQSHQRYLN